MHEYIVNLHMHTRFSDGNGTHSDIVAAAQSAEIDVIIVTDHNVWVQGVEGYYDSNNKKVLLLIGEEVHDQSRQPQKNHLLVFGAEKEMAGLATDPQRLINGVNEAGGIAFLAHPHDPAAPFIGEPSLSWDNWEVSGYAGIELWNAMTEFKSLLNGYPSAIFYAYNFSAVAHSPFPETLAKWDALLAEGKKVVAIGGSDAHQFHKTLGPLSKILFPYKDHFRAINTHILCPSPLSGIVSEDKKAIYHALENGHAFVANDWLAPSRDFNFSANCKTGNHHMGETVTLGNGVTLQIKLPQAAECNLICNGEIVRTSHKRETFVHQVTQPGAYRVEAYLPYRRKRRGWIYSNPIYVKA